MQERGSYNRWDREAEIRRNEDGERYREREIEIGRQRQSERQRDTERQR